MTVLDTKEIIAQLLGSPEQREQAVLTLSRNEKLKNDISTYVKRNSGSEHDAKTVLHDAIIVFVKKVYSNGGLQLEKGIEAYLFGIVKNLWSNTLRSRSKNRTSELKDSQTSIASDENKLMDLMSEEKRQTLEKVLASIGEKCRQVLMLWAYGNSMKLIASNLSYASEGMARKKKHQCLQKLKTTITGNQSLIDQLNY